MTEPWIGLGDLSCESRDEAQPVLYVELARRRHEELGVKTAKPEKEPGKRFEDS
jgi:hypothetical protein